MSSFTLVGAVAAVMVVLSLLGVLLNYLISGAAGLTSLVGLGLTCLLAWSLIQGWPLGRWFTVVSMGLRGIGSFVGGVTLFSHSVGFGLGMLVIGIINVVCAGALLTPAASEHFE
ncbi:MAG: hypothetical protein V4671_26110 [Armatimonadota bacterium]